MSSSRPATQATRPQLRRLFWAIGQLKRDKKLTAPRLAEQFETSVRTAYRDLDFLRDDWRVPVEYDRAEGTYRLTEPAGALPEITLSQGELLALYFAEKVLRQYRGTPFEADLVAAFRKIQDLLPESVSVSPESLDAYLSVDLGPLHTPDARVFAALLDAMRQQLRVRLDYTSLNSARTDTRLVDPYHVFNHRGDWYLAGHAHDRGEVRIFALHRVRALEPTGDTYAVPEDFDFSRYMADSFSIIKGGRPVEVAIRFAPRQARWIRERRWHPSARIQEKRDGGLVLKLKIVETGEIKRWVLQFGAEAEVLKPASLRRAVRKELAAAAKAYEVRRG